MCRTAWRAWRAVWAGTEQPQQRPFRLPPPREVFGEGEHQAGGLDAPYPGSRLEVVVSGLPIAGGQCDALVDQDLGQPEPPTE